jgi:NAD(P) transhydrogenase
LQITNLSPIIAFYHALVGAAAMLTCVATYMEHFPHLAADPVIHSFI